MDQLSGLDSVLVHTGVLSAQSASTSDWWDINELWFTPIDTLVKTKYIKRSLLKILGNNKYFFGIIFKKFYNGHSAENIRELMFCLQECERILWLVKTEILIFIFMFIKQAFCARFIGPMQLPITPTINKNVQFTVASNQKALIQLIPQAGN